LQIFRFAVGSGLFSLLILALTAANLAYTAAFLAAGLAVIVPAFRIHEEERVPLPDYSHGWKFLFCVITIGYGAYYFVNALAPEASPDGSTYHLGLVARYLREHGLGHITTSIYANLSEGLEMLFLAAFSFGRHSAAALIEFACFLLIPLVMIAYSQRFGFPKAGVAAALIIFCSPVFSISGSSAYNDAAAVLILFCLFYALQIWDSTRQTGMLIVAGLLAGFCYGLKYSVFLATPYCLGYVAWKLYRAKKPMVRPLLLVGGCALLLIAPWWIKNWVTVGNPLSPFGNKIFANQYVTPRFENEYVKGQKPTGPVLDRIVEATIRGGKYGGFLGPLFLLSPLGLLALRYQQGRQIVLAAGLFLIPALANAQTRFLMLAAPFVALALCLSVGKARGALAVLAMAAPIFALPAVADVYCDPWAWRLHDFPLEDAFRSIDEQQSLEKRLGGFRTTELLNRTVPVRGKIFATAAPEEAYIRREVLVSYQSAEGENLRDILFLPVIPDHSPSWILTFKFPGQALRAIRVLQTAAGTDADEWSVGEVKLYNNGAPMTRAKSWKLDSNANRWDLAYAFDENPVTRWGSRTAMFSGMRIQVDFGQPLTLDTVELDCSHDQWAIRLRLEGQDPSGNWKLLAASPSASERPVTADLRRLAMNEFKRHGIADILLNKDDFLLPDFQKHSEDWGVELAGQTGDDWLYAIK
jgi:hypothetical protein